MREIFEYIAIHRDTCSLTYGVGACKAALGQTGEEKCFNTIGTCQDIENFALTTTVDYFTSHENIKLPPNLMFNTKTAYPFLQSVKHKPAELNPGGASAGSDSLGKRAQITVSLIDAASDDQHQDKYYQERISGIARADNIGYNPDERGTFFSKHFARNTYLWGRRVDWVTGEIDENGLVTNSTMRTYVIRDVSGPDSSGRVTIVALDALMLTDSNTAQYPKPSTGQLSNDITDSQTSFTVTPSGAGAEYPASGTLQIGDEQMTYSRSGDSFTVTRGVNGSEREEHKKDDTVQWAWVVVNKTPDLILYDLLRNGTDIPPAMLNTTQWADEVSTRPWMQHNYSAVIGRPTGVKDLLNDIAQQQLFFPFVDERANDIKIKAIAQTFAPESVPVSLDGKENILADSFSRKKDESAAITRVYSHIGVRNWALDLKSAENYRTVLVNIAPKEESKERRGRPNSRDIYGYWLSDALADNLASTTMQQFAKAPEIYEFSLDAKDKNIKISDFVEIQDRNIVDSTGLPLKRSAQIVSATESLRATIWKYRAVAYSAISIHGGGDDGPDNYLIPIPTGGKNLNLRTLFNQVFADTNAAFADIATNNKKIIFYPSSSNIIIGSANTSTPSLITGFWPSSLPASALVFDFGFKQGVAGTYIVGAGGDGGDFIYTLSGGSNITVTTTAGKNGGDAFLVTAPIKILGAGIIGGGGGGGGGGHYNFGVIDPSSKPASGNGGAGSIVGKGGVAGSLGTSEFFAVIQGNNGTLTNGGTHGGGLLPQWGWGNLGFSGADGKGQYGKPGGAAGKSVIGYSLVDDSEFAGVYYGAKTP